jgi:hypothetical protein
VNWKGFGRKGLLPNEEFSWHLHGVTDEDHEETLDRLTDVSAVILTECFLNTDVEHYC